MDDSKFRGGARRRHRPPSPKPPRIHRPTIDRQVGLMLEDCSIGSAACWNIRLHGHPYPLRHNAMQSRHEPRRRVPCGGSQFAIRRRRRGPQGPNPRRRGTPQMPQSTQYTPYLPLHGPLPRHQTGRGHAMLGHAMPPRWSAHLVGPRNSRLRSWRMSGTLSNNFNYLHQSLSNRQGLAEPECARPGNCWTSLPSSSRRPGSRRRAH